MRRDSRSCRRSGVGVLADGLPFRFRSPGYWITATPASEWLIFLLEAGGEGMEITLWEVMDFGHSDGRVQRPQVFQERFNREEPHGRGRLSQVLHPRQAVARPS